MKYKIFLVLMFLVVGVTCAFNSRKYPAYFDDEGTYMSQAAAVLLEGKLAPYTYWYDHAPVGWLAIAGWAGVTGGIKTFGTSIDSGRAFMVVVHVINAMLIYAILAATTKRRVPGVVAVAIFGLSPLSITLSRMVFLDNIMLALVLAAFVLLLKQRRLFVYGLSGLLFGLAVLSKESALFFGPAFLVALWKGLSAKRRWFGIGMWIVVAGMTVGFYPLYALLKHELVEPAVGVARVSLVSALSWQATRKGGFFLASDSEFYYTVLHSWLPADIILVVGGTVATIMATVSSWKRHRFLPLVTLTWCYIGYLIRGGIVNDQYFIPLLGLFPLMMGLVVDAAIDLGKAKPKSRLVLWPIGLVIFLITTVFYSNKLDVYITDATTAQRQAIEWVETKLPAGSRMAVDGYMLADVLPIGREDIYHFKGPHHYWKIDQDPTIKANIFSDSWKRIDYVMLNNKIARDSLQGELPSILAAIRNSDPIETYTNPPTWYDKIKPYGYIWGHLLIADQGTTSIRKLKSPEYLAMAETWEGYKKAFIHSYGQVIDPQTGSTTSEGQAYAMLRAVWMNDKVTFDGTFAWARDHMQYRGGDKLFSWLWTKDNKLGDFNSATDADLDMAAALLFASAQWKDTTYLDMGKQLVNDIWRKEVVLINGRYYLTSGSNGAIGDGYLLNPSYFSPAYYRIFAKIDPKHPWLLLARDSYWLLGQLPATPPNWIYVNTPSGQLTSAKVFTGNDAENYGFDAFRTYFRVGLDYSWFDTAEARKYLDRADAVFRKEWKEQGTFKAIYTTAGKPTVDYTSLATLAGPVAVFSITDLSLAQTVYDKLVDAQLGTGEKAGYWGDGSNYYDQNWAWFMTGLYADKLPNLWK